MTKKINIFIASIIVVLCFSCSQHSLNEYYEDDKSDIVNDTPVLKLSINQSLRTAFPDVKLSDFESIILKGALYPDGFEYYYSANENLIELGKWSSSKLMSEAEIKILEGRWNFQLIASFGETTYVGTLEQVDIIPGNNEISFTINRSVLNPYGYYENDNSFAIEEGFGSVSLSLEFASENEVAVVEATFFNEKYETVEGYENISLPLQSDGEKTRAILEKENVKAGIYGVQFKFYKDEGRNCLIQCFTEQVWVSNLLTSRETINVTSFYLSYPITYEMFDFSWKEGYFAPLYTSKVSSINLPTASDIDSGDIKLLGWYEDTEYTIPVNSISSKTTTLYGKFEKPYKVNIYVQEEEGEEYSLLETIDAKGVLGQYTSSDNYIFNVKKYGSPRIESVLLDLDTDSLDGYLDAPSIDYQCIVRVGEKYYGAYTYTPSEDEYQMRLREGQIPGNNLIPEMFGDNYYMYQFVNERSKTIYIYYMTENTKAYYDSITRNAENGFTYVADGSIDYVTAINIIYKLDEDYDSYNVDLSEYTDITTISSYDFEGLNHVKSFIFPKNLMKFEEGVLCNSSVESVTIPASVTWIGMWSFDDCKNLKNIYFEDPIGWYTFIDYGDYGPRVDFTVQELSNPENVVYIRTHNEYMEWRKQS